MYRFSPAAAARLSRSLPPPAPPPAPPQFVATSVADGLPSSTVYKLAQDRDGFIWMGTQDGLARYDGVDFPRVPQRSGRAGLDRRQQHHDAADRQQGSRLVRRRSARASTGSTPTASISITGATCRMI